MTQNSMSSPKAESPWTNLIVNIALPAVILSKLSDEGRLGPLWAMMLALSLPLGNFIYSFITTRKTNFVSVLGFVSVLLSGGFGLMKLDGIWFAIKEAAVPSIIGVVVVGSLKTKYPLVRTFLFNDQIIDVARVEHELVSRGNKGAFDKLLVQTTWLLAFSFLVSAILNFGLARMVLKSPVGSTEFNQELGQMTALSWPVIVIPSLALTLLALWRLVSGISKLTGLSKEEVFKTPPPKKG